jgi:DNA-binding transcriptional LysR family regulator
MSLFDNMAAFVQVADSGSFSDAGRRLGVAKSVVSRRVTTLEAHLEASLFNRTTRRLSLTEIGQTYYDRARRILDDVAEAEDATRSLQHDLVGRLFLAAPTSFAHAHLSPVIAEFQTKNPRVEIELDLNDRQVDFVNEGFDLAVRIGVLQDSSLIARLLAPCRRVVCASPAYLAVHSEPKTLEDLEGRHHRFLVYSNRPVAEQWCFRAGDGWQVARVQSQRLAANNGEVIRDAAIGGLGLAVLPTFIASAPIVAGTLKVLLTDYQLLEPSIYAVWAPGRQLSTKVRALVDALGERFGATPYWDAAIAKATEDKARA